MKNILFIESSPRGDASYSNQAARSLVKELQSRRPGVNVVIRDLAGNPPPHVGPDFLIATQIPPAGRTPEQAGALALSDTFIDELLASDTVVIATPMLNFAPASALKAWIDHIVRAGRTFSYSSAGPQGLLGGRRAILVLASGGVYSNGPAKAFDFIEPYLRAVLGFVGITEVDVVRVEGLAVGDIGPEKALAAAAAKSGEILARAA